MPTRLPYLGRGAGAFYLDHNNLCFVFGLMWRLCTRHCFRTAFYEDGTFGSFIYTLLLACQVVVIVSESSLCCVPCYVYGVSRALLTAFVNFAHEAVIR